MKFTYTVKIQIEALPTLKLLINWKYEGEFADFSLF